MRIFDQIGEVFSVLAKIGPAIPRIEKIMADGWAGVQSGEVSIGDFLKAGQEAIALYQSFQTSRDAPSGKPTPPPTVTADDLNEQELKRLAAFGASVPWSKAASESP